MISVLLVATTVALIAYNLVQPTSRLSLSIDIARPLSFYGIFYCLYYILPYFLMLFSDQLPQNSEPTIAVCILLGYLAWYSGVKSSRLMEHGSISLGRLNTLEAQLLLVFCIVGIGLVAYVYAWRTYQGIFFTHARYYEQDLTVAGSFRDAFAMPLQLPIILLLGLLSGVPHQGVALLSRRLLLTYGSSIVVILVLSSQTRPAITALIFIFVAINLYRNLIVRPHHLALLGSIAVAVTLVVQGVRVGGLAEFALSDNQFIYAVEHTMTKAYAGVTQSGAQITEGILSRAGGGLRFLSEVIDLINDGEPHLYGQGIVVSLYSLVPRFIWQDKPAVASPQLVAQDLLYMPQSYDAPLGPITQFYVEGGLLGVIIGYWCFGWLMGRLTRFLFLSPGVGVLIVFTFVWGHVSNLENELVIGTLGILRNALIVYILYWGVLSILGGKPSRTNPIRT